ncbi:MAG TPA: hypothetical protein VJ418_08475 [Streptosporangiaceae bacterium]|nr:hypothetical protein [Streptosporangiaceae bacterium]HJY68951.1 hypothetical protein [Streptosporangiaceae bacterium]
MPQLGYHGLPLRTARISGLRQLVPQVPAPVVADALGFHHATTTRQHVNASATWSWYVAGERPDHYHHEDHGDRSRRHRGSSRRHQMSSGAGHLPDGEQDPGRAVESPAVTRTCGNESGEMRVLLSAYGARGDAGPLLGRRFPLGKTTATKDYEGIGQ